MMDESKTTKRDMSRVNEARKAALASKNSREIGREKMLEAIIWLYRWGYSSPTLIDSLSGAKAKGLSARLVKAGLAQKKPVFDGGGLIKGVPFSLIVLTKMGRDAAEQAGLGVIHQMPLKLQNIQHDFKIQTMTFEEKISKFRTPNELVADQKEGRIGKIFDAIWTTYSQNDQESIRFVKEIGIELELTPKSGQKLHEFVRKVVLAIRNERVEEVLIICGSESILRNYKAQFDKPEVPMWEKNPAGRWTAFLTDVIKEEERSKICFQVVKW